MTLQYGKPTQQATYHGPDETSVLRSPLAAPQRPLLIPARVQMPTPPPQRDQPFSVRVCQHLGLSVSDVPGR